MKLQQRGNKTLNELYSDGAADGAATPSLIQTLKNTPHCMIFHKANLRRNSGALANLQQKYVYIEPHRMVQSSTFTVCSEIQHMYSSTAFCNYCTAHQCTLYSTVATAQHTTVHSTEAEVQHGTVHHLL